MSSRVQRLCRSYQWQLRVLLHSKLMQLRWGIGGLVVVRSLWWEEEGVQILNNALTVGVGICDFARHVPYNQLPDEWGKDSGLGAICRLWLRSQVFPPLKVRLQVCHPLACRSGSAGSMLAPHDLTALQPYAMKAAAITLALSERCRCKGAHTGTLQDLRLSIS